MVKTGTLRLGYLQNATYTVEFIQRLQKPNIGASMILIFVKKNILSEPPLLQLSKSQNALMN